nr:NADH dehydrogenase subunit 6 [Neoheterobothrium hirame]
MFSILLFCYVLNLVLFSFTFNPIACSIILMFNSAVAGLLIYMFVGLSWYSLLLTMVYLGGVYIIILFVSSHIQNDQSSVSSVSVLLLSFMVMLICYSCFFLPVNLVTGSFESESFSNLGGISLYLVFSFVLLFMFYLISLLLCSKEGFLR